MEMEFKRSFLGYSHEKVDKTLKAMHEEYELHLKDLEEQYSQAEYDVQILKDQIQELKNSMTAFQTLEEEFSKMLVTAHLAACEKVMTVFNLADEMEEEALNNVFKKKNKITKLKKTMNDLTKEIQSVTNRYSNTLEEANNE